MVSLGNSISQFPKSEFWSGKRVLVTGHTGFKGGWLTFWLKRMGAEVTGLSLPPHTCPSFFELAKIKTDVESHICDIRDLESTEEIIKRANPEIVFHLAAQPLVRKSYENPIDTYNINIMGTANILESLRKCNDVRVAVMVTTDKVYKNFNHIWPFREGDTLGGHDPYSASKAASEIIIDSYRDAFFKAQGVAIASGRAGNVIGGGDWSEDRLFPDAIRAWQSGSILEIRRPNSIRPWQHVLEPINSYLKLAEKLSSDSGLEGGYNFGPGTGAESSVKHVIEMAKPYYNDALVHYHEDIDGPYEEQVISLETAKAKHLLDIYPIWNLSKAVEKTMTWYRSIHEGGDAGKICDNNISEYEVIFENDHN